MTAFFPAMPHRAGATIKRPSAGVRTTILTMSGIFSRSGEFTTMNALVTGHTKGLTVVNIKHKFWKIRYWFYVVSVNIATFCSAFLAGVIVSLINCITPLSKIATSLRSLSVKGLSALPYWGCVSGSPFDNAFIGAEFSTMVNSVKLFTARFASFVKWLTAIRPARFRTVFGGVRAIGFDFVGRSTYYASFHNLSVFHNTNYTTQHTLLPCYVAIQRWVDVTGGTPELVEPVMEFEAD